jgi:4-oxalocrotonate tautomerase
LSIEKVKGICTHFSESAALSNHLPKKGGTYMPLIQVKLIEGVYSYAKKEEIIKKLTDTVISIEGRSLRPLTWVLIQEVKSADFGIGGKEIATYDIRVKVVEGALSQEQKQQVIQKVADTMTSIEGKGKGPANWVKVEEVKNGDFGIGGKVMTRDEIMALAAESYERF